ncbi:tetratricopeptide repeat protein [Pseudoduganella violaceinigra]|uniref:tetratricopeptide repeat protein n=1 Tax=Pseudoduganella violaceinigra TaxID=246602 RepID=UPI0004086351|nr:SEL1-like repeat protein [Pseudoduganella violaceinigra]
MANREELVIIRGARAGDAAAQLALGKLYLFGGASLPQNVPTALYWLCRAAQQGVADAWRLIGAHIPFEVALPVRSQALPWYARAAQEGVPAAVRVLAQLRRIDPPLPAEPAPAPPSAPSGAAAPSAARLAGAPDAWRALEADRDADQDDLLRLRTLAAQGGDRDAQLALGLHLARMNSEGDRVASMNGTVNFKRALRWLTQAGEQGLADAWFAMSRIYIRPEFSQRSASEAQACLERAAGMGHSAAQLECGIHAWRARRGAEDNDVRAVYWLQKAAAQGSAEARQALERIAPPQPPASWAEPLVPLLTRELLGSQPLLAARIELAVLFRLTRAEALLLDVTAADQGHCLVVDIRASYGRSKRRLVLVRTAAERQKLDRILRLFEQVDADLEGNYRQRLYRLKSWFGAGMMAAA